MAVYSHRLFQRHHILPQDFYEMDDCKKAFIIASEQIQIEEEKKLDRR